MRPPRVLTWHVHGNYLFYLAQAGVEFYLPVAPGRPGHGGRGTTFPFGDNVREVPTEAVPDLELDGVLFQSRVNYEVDQHALLSDAQKRLPRVYLEHDPPQGHPTDTRHWFDDPGGLLVHVTPFNALMWDSGRTPTRVIDHGVIVPEGVRYTGELERGVVVVNHLKRRGRRLGADVFQQLRGEVPLDLVGMDAESLGGLGEVFPPELPAFEARYRFFFNPVRYTSLGLAVLEAMAVGLPVVGLATTEMVTAVENGVSEFLDTDPANLVGAVRELLADRGLARQVGAAARRRAGERFGIGRFARDWERAFADVTGRHPRRGAAVVGGYEAVGAPV
jgi:glycosyltransferase involved in cell wall biosynthesis